MQTQWRVGFGGATGLDYLALDKTAAWLGVRMNRLMLEKIQILETSQLNRWAAQRKTKKGQGDGT